MKKKLLVALVSSLLAFSVGSALAQPYGGPGRIEGHGGPGRMEARGAPYRIQPRIDAQQREIRQGVRDGSLNRREATILKSNLSKINREYNRAKRSDRYVSMAERERLNEMLDRNGRMIRRMENNGVTRF